MKVQYKFCFMCLNVCLNSVEELCAVDLYDPDTRDSHATLELLLSASKQLHLSGILSSVLHNQVACTLISDHFIFYIVFSMFLHLVCFCPGSG